MMNRKYFWVILGVTAFCVLLIFFSMWHESHSHKPDEQIVKRPKPPFKTYISGVGIVESSSENILIGTPMNRIVDKVEVGVGMRVKKGEVLLRLDSRDLAVELRTKELSYANAIANVRKLEEMPRLEDVSSAEAVLKNAQVGLDQAKSEYEMVQALKDPRALSKEEINRRRFAFEQAQARMQQAAANLEKVNAGTWQPDLEIARIEVLQAKANVDRVKAEIERTIIRSPIDGKVLQIRIHEGELPPPDTSRSPIMIVGNTDEMHLRVSINQFDASYFHSNAPAVAFLQGDARTELPLEYLQIEPFLVSKQNLTNDIMERVDTRVLQVIYSFKSVDQRIFIGQQMDVFIKSDFPPEGDHVE